jgi:uncharacterized membrane protein
MTSDSDTTPQVRKSPAGTGIAVGAALGLAFGVAYDELALGLALGAAFGAAFDVVEHVKHKGGPKAP